MSSVEATRGILDRIDKLDGKLKSYAIVTSANALKQATQLDGETTSGRALGPLHGVPISFKQEAVEDERLGARRLTCIDFAAIW